MSQIELEQIRKTFRISHRPEGRFSLLRGAFTRTSELVRALDDVSFRIQEGELVGYIGPNGAGKSTTVKIMSGILTPDSGHCKIMGRTPWSDRIAHVSRIGVVFGQRSQLWWDVPVSDSLSLLKDIYRIPASDYKRKLSDLTQALDLGSLLKTPVRQLSLGQRMRCEIAAALIHSPRIIFLDEPTIGLDAVSKLSLREFLKQENAKNAVTMILTTHDMNDIEALCTRVMVIGHGKLLYDGALDSLKERYSKLRCIRATLQGYLSPFDIEGAEKIEVDANIWTVLFDPAKTPAHKMIERLSRELPLHDIVMEEQDIDEIIAAMYKEMRI